MKKVFKINLAPDAASDAAGGGGGDGTISQADLTKGIEKARMEERTRLKDQLTALTSQLEAAKQQAEAAVTAKTTVEAELTALKTAHEALKVGLKADGGVDVEKAIQSAIAIALAQQGPALQQEIANLRSELGSERSKRETAESDQLRSRLIAEAGGASALIPELVTGRTPEEIATSIESSKQIFVRTIGAATSGGGGSTTASTTGNPPPQIPLGGNRSASNGGAGTASGGTAPLIPGGRMALADFAKNRQALKTAALSRARGQ